MPREHSTSRLFVALYPPPDTAQAMLDAARKCVSNDARVVAAGQVHLTVHFIGDVDSRQERSVVESVNRSASGVRRFVLTPGQLIGLPRGRNPRLVAIETDLPGELMEIHRRLVHRLAREARPKHREHFLPHFTLVRFNHGANAHFEQHKAFVPAFEVDHIRVMRSVLRTDGAIHHEVSRFELDRA